MALQRVMRGMHRYPAALSNGGTGSCRHGGRDSLMSQHGLDQLKLSAAEEIANAIVSLARRLQIDSVDSLV
jgi:hypothetical protein